MRMRTGFDVVALDASGDALSDVLDLIRLRGEELTAVRATHATEIRHTTGERLVHVVQHGTFTLVCDGQRHHLGQGDLALVATGIDHQLHAANDAQWMSGRFVVEEQVASSLLAVLPPSIVLRGADAGLEWLAISASLLAAELADPGAGSRAMVSRILDLMFICALRTWSDSGSPGADPGWLTAALDRPIGPVLQAIHRHLEHPWTVDELAGLASMSRAAFAARFTRLTGAPPARYLARMRLARAADQLAASSEPVGAIGNAVGYGSDSAFTRAFTREYGKPPRAWRASQHMSPTPSEPTST